MPAVTTSDGAEDGTRVKTGGVVTEPYMLGVGVVGPTVYIVSRMKLLYPYSTALELKQLHSSACVEEWSYHP
jgi:hypothetical protein